MGAVGGMLGLAGGAAGTGFAAPTSSPLVAGTNSDQLNTAYGGAQNSLASQQALLTALQAQNGLGNQSQVYNQLQGVVNGTGPNPAQAQLAQATGANTANQAALMAGQRGAGANVGLIARQAAQQGAANQQNAAGQAAALQAQQSLNAINSAGNIANTQAANQIGATTANTQAQQSEQQILQNANAAYNNSNVALQSNINNANAQLAGNQMTGQQSMIGGTLNGLGGLMSSGGGGSGGAGMAAMAGAEGGEVPVLQPALPIQPTSTPVLQGPQSSFGQFLKGFSPSNQGDKQSVTMTGPGALQQGMASFVKGFRGKPNGAPAQSQDDDNAQDEGLAMGGNVGSKLKSGGHVPGTPKVPGNSYSNDTVKALLSPGEVVIPNNIMQSKNPIDGAAKFVAAVLAKKGRK